MDRNTLRRRVRRGLPLTLSLLCLPAAAHASTLGYDGAGALVFTGGAGGTLVHVAGTDDGRASFEPQVGDDFAGLPAGCDQAGPGEPAICAVTGAGVRVEMGDGDDDVNTFRPLTVPATFDGGAGNDELTGSFDGGDETMRGGPGNDRVAGMTGADVLDGGEGDDVVQGGLGADTVLGGPGADKVNGDDSGGIDPDRIDGGPGHDTLEGEYSTVGREGRGLVALTLDGGGPDGFAGEGDDVTGIERVAGSTGGSYAGTEGADELLVGGEPATVEGRGGDDTIFTSYSNDTIDGGAGADTIRGYAGDDRIVGGPGPDTIFGDTQGQTCNVLTCSISSGNDVIDARDGERDSVDCGLGTDTALVDAVDVTANCEAVQTGSAAGGAGGAGAGGGAAAGGSAARGAKLATSGSRRLRTVLAKGLTLRIRGARRGRVALTARSGRTKVAACTLRVSAKGTGRCVLRFTKSAKRKLRRSKRVKLRITGRGVAPMTLSLRR
jgi:Ca2+-binding RTX toxin-like protein